MRAVLSGLVLLHIFLTPVFSANWFQYNWVKRVPLSITNNTSTLTGYHQVFLSTAAIDSSEWEDIKGITGRADLADIRFTKSDGYTPLEYWIEQDTSQPRGFWIKYEGDLPPGNSGIYLYYGNQNAVSKSTGPLTFDFFDDFTDPDFNSHWTTITKDTWTIVNGFAHHGRNNYGNRDYLVSSLGNINAISEIRLKIVDTTNFGDSFSFFTRSNGSYIDENIIQYLGNTDSNYFKYGDFGNWTNAMVPGPKSNSWYRLKLSHNIENIKVYIDTGTGYELKVTSVTDHTAGTHIGFVGIYCNSYVDYIFQRKYSLTDPALAIAGNTETYSSLFTKLIEGVLNAKAITNDGSLVGVPVDSPIEVGFDLKMDTVSLEGAVSLRKVRDSNGDLTDEPIVPDSVVYFSTSNKLVLAGAPLAKGYAYELKISTDARDATGVCLPRDFYQTFFTIMDFSAKNTVKSSDGRIVIVMPAGCVATGDWYMIIDTGSFSGAAAVATAKAETDWGYKPVPESFCKVSLYGQAGNPLTDNFAKPAELTLKYNDSDDDKSPDSISPPVPASSLGICLLDESSRLWMKLPSLPDADARTVTAQINHFSYYGIFTKASAAADDIYAFPVPWRPNSGNPARYGSGAGGITFANLPADSRIRIFSVAGELAKEITHGSTGPSETWDGRNEAGNLAASGVYIYSVEAPGLKKTGKLMIVR
jgi:hypothetical protein